LHVRGDFTTAVLDDWLQPAIASRTALALPTVVRLHHLSLLQCSSIYELNHCEKEDKTCILGAVTVCLHSPTKNPRNFTYTNRTGPRPSSIAETPTDTDQIITTASQALQPSPGLWSEWTYSMSRWPGMTTARGGCDRGQRGGGIGSSGQGRYRAQVTASRLVLCYDSAVACPLAAPKIF
jgi:hypothetical protein